VLRARAYGQGRSRRDLILLRAGLRQDVVRRLTVEKTPAIAALGALAHEGRLDVFRLLVQAGPDGMAAGDIARATGAIQSTLSANLAVLTRAGLIAARRDGRSIIYAAAYDRMRELLGFLMEDCCAGKPEICAPLLEVANRSCPAPAGTSGAPL
jgi:DNA-binding transcriptional ArsR family regulator